MGAIEFFKQIPGGWWCPGFVILLILLVTNIEMYVHRCMVLLTVGVVVYPIALIMSVITGNDMYPACSAYLAATGACGVLSVRLLLGAVCLTSWCYHTWNGE